MWYGARGVLEAGFEPQEVAGRALGSYSRGHFHSSLGVEEAKQGLRLGRSGMGGTAHIPGITCFWPSSITRGSLVREVSKMRPSTKLPCGGKSF